MVNKSPLCGSTGSRRTEENKRKFSMNTKTIIAVALIVLGIVVLAYSGISFTTPGQPVNFLGMHFETKESHFIPPVAGMLALVGGIVLLIVNPKRA
jgi:hypothetical protein